MDKLVRDGKVAVLVSTGFGAGWSTWANEEQKQAAMFDRRLVEAAEQGVTDIEPICRDVFGTENFYTGGWPVEIEWLPEGTAFTIEEYDGYESLRDISDLSIIA